MLAEVLGREPAGGVRAELLRLSGGNPFALEELARAAVDSGWLDPATGRRRGTGAVELPWTLAESIRARAARLAPRRARDAALGGRCRRALRHPPAGARRGRRDGGSAAGHGAAGRGRDGRRGRRRTPPASASPFATPWSTRRSSQEGLAAQRAGSPRPHPRGRRGARRRGDARAVRRPSWPATRWRPATGRGRWRTRARRPPTPRRSAPSRRRSPTSSGPCRSGPSTTARRCGPSCWCHAGGCARAARTRRRARRRAAGVRARRPGARGREGPPWCRAAAGRGLWRGRQPRAGSSTTGSAAVERSGAPAPREAPAHGAGAQARPSRRAGPGRGAADAEEGLALVPEVTTVGEARDRVSLLATVGLVRLWRCDGRRARERCWRRPRGWRIEHHDDVGASRAYNQLATGNLLLTPLVEGVDRGRVAVELAARHGLHTMQAHYLACQTWLTHPRRRLGATRGGSSRRPRRSSTRRTLREYTRWNLAEARADLGARRGGSRGRRRRRAWRSSSGPSPSRATASPATPSTARRSRASSPATRPAPAASWGPSSTRFLELIGQGAAEAEVLVPKVQVLVAAGDQEQARRWRRWAHGRAARPSPDPVLRRVARPPPMRPMRGRPRSRRPRWRPRRTAGRFEAACDRVLARRDRGGGRRGPVGGGRPAARGARALRRDRLRGLVRRVNESLRALGERGPDAGRRRGRRPVGAGAGGARPGRRGAHQPPDRRAPGDQRAHRRFAMWPT